MSIIIHIPDHILFEDKDILLINKPCSLMVEPDRNGHPNLLQQVQKYVKQSLHPNKEVYAQHIHRLDRPVSGVVLFAKKKSMLRDLSEQFAHRKVKKYYKAITMNKPPESVATLEHWLFKDTKNKKAVIHSQEWPNADKVLLSYTTAPYQNGQTLWDIALHTGKYHQIRAQLGAVGAAILGDTLYGSEVVYAPNSIALHAYALEFTHPATKEAMRFEAPTNWLV